MSRDKNGPDLPEECRDPLRGETGAEVEELRRLQRLIAEAQARGEDPSPLVKRMALATIDVVASRIRRAPDHED